MKNNSRVVGEKLATTKVTNIILKNKNKQDCRRCYLTVYNVIGLQQLLQLVGGSASDWQQSN